MRYKKSFHLQTFRLEVLIFTANVAKTKKLIKKRWTFQYGWDERRSTKRMGISGLVEHWSCELTAIDGD